MTAKTADDIVMVEAVALRHQSSEHSAAMYIIQTALPLGLLVLRLSALGSRDMQGI